MKKLMSIIVIISLVGLSSTPISTIKNSAKSVVTDLQKDNITYLIYGLDDAAGNTDVILLINYSSSENTLSFIHVPRDTYFKHEGYEGKINGLPIYLTQKGADMNTALSKSARITANALGVEIDGYVAYTTHAISRLVDSLGGITLNITRDINSVDENGKPVKITAGTKHLGGSEAIAYLRYRSGYANADLGRIEAQKIFLSYLISKMKTEFSINTGIKLLRDSGEGIYTDVKIIDFVNFALKNRGRIDTLSSLFYTLPGQADYEGNVSYYFINKVSASKMLKNVFGESYKQFDTEESFKNNIKKHEDYYYSTIVYD